MYVCIVRVCVKSLEKFFLKMTPMGILHKDETLKSLLFLKFLYFLNFFHRSKILLLPFLSTTKEQIYGPNLKGKRIDKAGEKKTHTFL